MVCNPLWRLSALLLSLSLLLVGCVTPPIGDGDDGESGSDQECPQTDQEQKDQL